MSVPNTSHPASSLSLSAILVLALLSAVAPLATDMYLPGFPAMADDLDAQASTIQMTLTAFLLGLAAGQIVIGPLSDRFGRRLPLLIGVIVAIVSSALCAVAPNTDILIALRAIQGLGGAAGVVLARAIIADRTHDATASAKLFQLMMLIGGLAPVLAPIVGTGIVALGGWRLVFVVIAVLMAISFLGVIRYIDESLPIESRVGGGMGALASGMRTVLANRAYLGYTLTTAFSFMVMFGYIAASPFVFQGILGMTPAAYSVAFGVNAIGIAIVGATSAKLVGGISPRRLTAIGLAVLVAGAFSVLGCVLTGAGTILMLPAIFVTVASVGMILGNSSALAISQTPHNAGTGSAVLGALQFCFGAIASPLVGLAGKDSALPMALVMVIAALLALASFLFLTPRWGQSRAHAEMG